MAKQVGVRAEELAPMMKEGYSPPSLITFAATVTAAGSARCCGARGCIRRSLTTWRRERERGELDGLAPKKRGRKADPDRELAENQRLAREVARLKRRLAQAEGIIDVQK